MEEFIMRLAYKECVKLFSDRICLGWKYQEIDYASEDEIKKVNNHIFEASIIVIAIMKYVIEQNIKLNPIYHEKYSNFISLRLEELSHEPKHSEIFLTGQSYLNSTILARIEFYKSEIKELIENKIITFPLRTLYNFILDPGNYTNYKDERNYTNEKMKIAIENRHNSYSKMDIVFAIKDVYNYLVSRIV